MLPRVTTSLDRCTSDPARTGLASRLREALTVADFTYAAVAGALGTTAHAALSRNETLPGLRSGADCEGRQRRPRSTGMPVCRWSAQGPEPDRRPPSGRFLGQDAPGDHRSSFDVHSEIPLRSGLGSSAAATVAGLRLGELVDQRRGDDELLLRRDRTSRATRITPLRRSLAA